MRRKEIVQQVISGGALQVTNAVLSFIKVPILIQGLGENEYLRIAVIISFWSYMSFRGEVNRKNTRVSYAENHELILMGRDYLTAVIGILLTTLLLIDDDQRKHWLETVLYMTMIVICGYIYSRNARSVGFLEASGKINQVNLLQTLSQITIFPFFVVAAGAGNFFATYLTFLLSFIGGGILVNISSRSSIGKEKTSTAISESRKWKEVTLWEMIPSSLFPFVISVVCTKSELLQFLVYQKFTIAFAALPVALAPLFSLLHFQKDRKLIEVIVRKISLIFLMVLVLVIVIFEQQIVGFMSDERVSPSPQFLISLIFSGLLGVYFSPFQNSASYGKTLEARLFALRMHVPIAIVMLVLTAGLYGSYFGFVWSAYLSMQVPLLIRIKLKKGAS